MSRDTPFAEFAAGTVVLNEGEAARAMFIIESGRIEIRRNGNVLAELGPGEVFGEMALLQEQPHSATAVARTAVRALEIDQASFHAVLRANPEVAVQLMRQLVARLNAGEQRRAELESRLAAGTPAARSPSPPAARSSGPGAADGAPATPARQPGPGPAPAPTTAPPPAAAGTAAPQPAAPASAPPPVPIKAAAQAASASAALPNRPAAPASAAEPAARAPQVTQPPAAAAPTPGAAKAAAAGRLVIRHAQGEIVVPAECTECLIGRPDPATGKVPEIDLGGLDVARSLSRRHARLRRDGARWILSEEPGVANGTWVNGERLQPGATATLSTGDRLRFGAVEVEFAAA